VRPQSAKAKGRRLQQEAAAIYLSTFPQLEPDDITSRSMGAGGTDLLLSPAAKRLIPFDHECKNQESLNIWEALKQAEENAKAGRIPLLVFKRNHSRIYAALPFVELLDLVQKVSNGPA
jgi:hypothetical protein